MVRRSAALFPFSLLDELVRGTLAPVEHPLAPPLEILAGDAGVQIRAALPGIDPSSLDVALEEQVLRIRARAPDHALKDARPLSQELARGDVDLALRLAFRPDRASLKATYAQGVLVLELPRASEELSHKIAVETR